MVTRMCCNIDTKDQFCPTFRVQYRPSGGSSNPSFWVLHWSAVVSLLFPCLYKRSFLLLDTHKTEKKKKKNPTLKFKRAQNPTASQHVPTNPHPFYSDVPPPKIH